MTSAVFYDSTAELATVTATFQNALGSNTDPSVISCIITDPSGAQTTHTYQGAAPADITRASQGVYQLLVACSPSVAGADGLWGFVFIGTGAVNDAQPGTWRVLPTATSQVWYIGLEEFKDRLSITDNLDDYACQTAIASSAGWINEYCGRHFNRVAETRTFVPYDIYSLDVDDIVPGTAIALSVDFDGDGTYEQSWTQGTDYQLFFGRDRFNQNATGIARPWGRIRVINSGRTFPFLWPFAPINRVQIATTWGWPSVPWQVAEANRILAADLFRMKDAPFGLAGSADYGVSRISANPWLMEMLRPYVRAKHKVGV